MVLAARFIGMKWGVRTKEKHETEVGFTSLLVSLKNINDRWTTLRFLLSVNGSTYAHLQWPSQLSLKTSFMAIDIT